jgi:hypothetical protein
LIRNSSPLYKRFLLKHLSSIFVVLCPLFLHAQYFEKVYGHDDKVSGAYFAITGDRGVVIVGDGFDTTYHTYGYYILRTDSDGNSLWDHSISNAFSAYAYSVATLSNGNMIFLGTHSGVAFQNVAELNVLDSAGNYLNSFVYPPFDGWGTAGIGLTKSSDTSVALTLFNDGFISNNYYSVFSLNADLTTKWNDFVGFDGSFTNEQGLTACANGDIYTLSYYDNYFFGVNPLFEATAIRRHDYEGNIRLDSIYEFQCVTTGIDNTLDGGAVICGIQDTSFQRDIVIIKIDSSGNLMWQKQYGSFFDEEAYAVRHTPDGGYIVLSNIVDPVLPTQHDLLLLKLDANGDSLWAHKFGGVLDETALNIETEGNDIIILGKTTSFGIDHIYLVRTDSAGIIEAPYTVSSSARYLCSGDTATLTLSPSPAASSHILWSNGDSTLTSHVFATGNYFATITDSGGAVHTTQFIPVYVARRPDASFAADTVRLCAGSALIDTASSELTNTYEWFLDGTQIQGEVDSYIYPQQPGNYQLIVRNFCSSDTSASYLDTLFSLPDQPVIVATPIDYVCPGDSFQLYVPQVSGNIYQWYSADDFNQYIITGATDTVYYVNTDGLYLVQATNTNGCVAQSYPYDVAFDNDRVFVNPNGPTSFCQGGDIDLNVLSGTDFLWSTGDTTQYINVNSSGDYFATFIDQNGCPKASDTITIHVLNNPVVNLGNDTNVCQSVALILNAGSGYNNYLWNTSSVDPTISAFSPGPYPDTLDFYVFVTDTNGCTDSDTIRVVFDICSGIFAADVSSFGLFPNPVTASEDIHVFVRDENEQTFELYDATGNEVMRKIFRKQVSFTPAILPGVYFYRILDSRGEAGSGILVVH